MASTDTVTITALPALPTLTVTAPATVVWPDPIALTITSDASVTTTVKTRPAGTVAALVGGTTKTPTLTPDFDGGLGEWVFQTTATGPGGTEVAERTVEVVAEAVINGKPMRAYLAGEP